MYQPREGRKQATQLALLLWDVDRHLSLFACGRIKPKLPTPWDPHLTVAFAQRTAIAMSQGQTAVFFLLLRVPAHTLVWTMAYVLYTSITMYPVLCKTRARGSDCS